MHFTLQTSRWLIDSLVVIVCEVRHVYFFVQNDAAVNMGVKLEWLSI